MKYESWHFVDVVPGFLSSSQPTHS